MSLILDALRKSEAERQRGQAPGLFVQQALPPRRRRRPSAAWLGLGAALLAVAALAWVGRDWLSGRAGGAADAPAAAPLADALPSHAPSSPAGATTVAAPPPASAPATVPAAAGDTPSAPQPQPQVPSPAPAPAQAPTPAPAPDPAAPAPNASPIEGYEVDARPPNEIPATPDLREAPEPKPAPPAGESGALPRIADLPAAERAALPPLKLSMHVYAEDPAQRFVILDGRRLAEGGVLAEGVLVQSIGREGLVLSVQGRPYWLAR